MTEPRNGAAAVRLILAGGRITARRDGVSDEEEVDRFVRDGPGRQLHQRWVRGSAQAGAGPLSDRPLGHRPEPDRPAGPGRGLRRGGPPSCPRSAPAGVGCRAGAHTPNTLLASMDTQEDPGSADQYLAPEAGHAVASTRCSRPPAGSCRTTGRSPSVRPRAWRSESSRWPPVTGRADYLLFVDRKAVGVDRGQEGGRRRSRGVEWQSAEVHDRAAGGDGRPGHARCRSPTSPPASRPASRTGSTRNRASRRVFSFHRPETLAEILDSARRPDRGLRNATLRDAPPAAAAAWTRRGCGRRRRPRSATPRSRSTSFKPRALIQMATGSGKTFTAANISYRLDQVRRRTSGPVPGRPGEPRSSDAEGVPAVRHARRRPEVHRAVQRAAPRRRTRSTRSPGSRSRRSSGCTRCCEGEELPEELDERVGVRGRAAGTGRGRLQPGGPDRDVRRDHRRRVPPLDLRRVAAGPGVLRRLPHRADRDARASRRSGSSTRTS